MRRMLSLCALFSVLFAASPAGAAQPTPVPDRKPDFSSMMFLIGSWTCHANVPDRGDRPSHSMTTMDQDGRFMKTVDDSPPFDQARTRHFIATDWVTYNADQKVWADIGVDNYGNYGLSTSPGWTGNAMTWTTVSASDGSTGSSTMTKVSDTEIRSTNTSVANGKSSTFTGSCKKDA